MATPTTLTIQQNVLSDLGLPTDNSTLQGRALRWLNKTLDKLQTYVPEAEFLQTSEIELTLVVNQATYALPADFFHLLQLRSDTDSIILNVLTREKFDREHPNPSREDPGSPRDVTLEYDRSSNRNIIRIGPAPDNADTYYAIMRRWHPSLSSSQDVQWDKLETVLEEGAFYHGALVIYADPEYTQYRAELKTNWLESAQGISQILALQKPNPSQIPVVLRGPQNQQYQRKFYY